MNKKLGVFILCLSLILFTSILATVVAETEVWREDFNYSSVSQLESAGWTTTHSSGISFTPSGIVLDGTDDDTAIHYTRITNGPTNWAVETKSRWLGQGHSGNGACIVTQDHIYGITADGYYHNFALYVDCAKVETYDGYKENANSWITMRIEKVGNTLQMYYNSQLIGTYDVNDNSRVTGVDHVSPWEGDAEYDYIHVYDISAFTESSGGGDSSGGVFSNPLVIGGAVVGVGAAVGVAVYYFVFAGGSAAASASASSGAAASGGAGSAGGSGGGGSGGGTLIHHPTPEESIEASLSGTVSDNLVADATTQTATMSTSTATASEGATPTSQTAGTSGGASQYQIQPDPQDVLQGPNQDVTQNKPKTQDKMFQVTDQYIRASTDSDSTVADSGNSSGSEG